MSEINPNHPVTAASREHWHKLCAIAMRKMGVKHVRITSAELQVYGEEGINIAVRFGEAHLELFLFDLEEAKRLGATEGGLPV